MLKSIVWSCHFYRFRWCMCLREREGGGSQRERGCVRIHMPIELVCSKGGPQALPIWCWRFYYSFRDVMAKGGGRRWGWGEGMEGGTMAHEGKVSQYYVFFPRWQRQMKPCFCLQTSKILTPRSGAVRRCAVDKRSPGKNPWLRAHYLSHLDVCNGIDDRFVKPLHGISFLANYLAASCNSPNTARTQRRGPTEILFNSGNKKRTLSIIWW